MPVHPPSVSVTDPISPALQRVKRILFAPFDIKKWFVIGFCAWLSSCGEAGGGGGGGGGGGNRSGGNADRGEISHGIETAWQYVLDNLVWILPLVILVILLGVTVWLVAVWLNSRGKFMLLHCVSLDRAEIQVPWDKYAQHAHSLFLFQVCLGAIAFVIIFPIVIAIAAVLLLALAKEASLTGPIIICVLGVLCVIGVSIIFAIIKKLLVDFVVPIMYLRTPSVRAGWTEFRSLASANLGRFALYLLFSVVITMIIATLIFVVVIATCCIAGCIMAIPYIGTVLLLPVFVFKRAYSLYYFQQYGPDYSVIRQEDAPPVAEGGV